MREERGAVMMYALLALVLLAIFTPAVIHMVSAASRSVEKTDDEKRVTISAKSAMNSFISYIEHAKSTDGLAYYNAYPLWGAHRFAHPDGSEYELIMDIVQESSGQFVHLAYEAPSLDTYHVRVRAISGDEHPNQQRDPDERSYAAYSIVYEIPLRSGSGGEGFGPGGILNPSQPRETPPASGSNAAIYYGDQSPYGSNLPGLSEAIGEYVAAKSADWQVVARTYYSQATPCGGSCLSDSSWSGASADDPAVIYTSRLSIDQDVTIGAPDKPVILIVDTLSTSNNANHIRIYGSLFVRERLEKTNNSQPSFYAYRAGERYGDLYLNSDLLIEYKNSANFTVEGSFYTTDIDFQNSPNITVGMPGIGGDLIVNGDLDAHNSIDATVHGAMILGGVFDTHNSPNVSVRAGDLLIRDDFLSHNSVNITTGGAIGVGGSIDLHNSPNFATGQYGYEQTIILPDGSHASSPVVRAG